MSPLSLLESFFFVACSGVGWGQRSAEPEQWLQRHPEAGPSWLSWPNASHRINSEQGIYNTVCRCSSSPAWGPGVISEREQRHTVEGHLRERQGQNLALTGLYVPYSPDIGSQRETAGEEVSLLESLFFVACLGCRGPSSDVCVEECVSGVPCRANMAHTKQSRP